MTERTERLLEALLELPRAERIEVFDRLGSSLAPPGGASLSEAWRDEIRSRIEKLDAGTSELVDVADVERDLWAEQDADELAALASGR